MLSAECVCWHFLPFLSLEANLKTAGVWYLWNKRLLGHSTPGIVYHWGMITLQLKTTVTPWDQKCPAENASHCCCIGPVVELLIKCDCPMCMGLRDSHLCVAPVYAWKSVEGSRGHGGYTLWNQQRYASVMLGTYTAPVIMRTWWIHLMESVKACICFAGDICCSCHHEDLVDPPYGISEGMHLLCWGHMLLLSSWGLGGSTLWRRHASVMLGTYAAPIIASSLAQTTGMYGGEVQPCIPA
jgi:hypothetical protein